MNSLTKHTERESKKKNFFFSFLQTKPDSKKKVYIKTLIFPLLLDFQKFILFIIIYYLFIYYLLDLFNHQKLLLSNTTITKMSFTNFLELSTEISEPFIIPNVSPVTSPKLASRSARATAKMPSMGTDNLTPLVAIEEHDEEIDSTLISTRKLSVLDLN